MDELIGFGEFINRYKGKFVEWDGVSKNQCVDLAKAYIQLCYGIPTGSGKAVWGNAKDYYNNFPAALRQKFTRIANTPELVPKQGDLCIFGSGKYGHICIADGTGNTKQFYSYDQNYGNPKTVRRVRHTYSGFLGVLRPKVVAKNATTAATKSETSGTVKTVVASLLNVRSQPNGNADIIKVLKYGTKVKVIREQGSWSMIADNQWVCTVYLR